MMDGWMDGECKKMAVGVIEEEKCGCAMID